MKLLHAFVYVFPALAFSFTTALWMTKGEMLVALVHGLAAVLFWASISIRLSRQ